LDRLSNPLSQVAKEIPRSISESIDLETCTDVVRVRSTRSVKPRTPRTPNGQLVSSRTQVESGIIVGHRGNALGVRVRIADG
jgi:hypothetical protein